MEDTVLDQPQSGTARAAYDITEFCAAYRVSRAKLYLLWKEGIGPDRKRIGRKTIITVAAVEAWARSDNEGE
jgi:hypothetical protein